MLLYPGIRLMSRLSFIIKFSLVSFLFIVPLLVTNGYLVRGSLEQIRQTETEQQGLLGLRDMLHGLTQVRQLADLLQINVQLAGGEAGAKLNQRLIWPCSKSLLRASSGCLICCCVRNRKTCCSRVALQLTNY